MATGTNAVLNLREARHCRWDLISLGEVMLRLDPGDVRLSTTREFRAWEGGGEYNVARGLRRCFGMKTSIVTALVDNPVGRLLEDLMLQGGVDLSLVRWVPYDDVGRSSQRPQLCRKRFRRARRAWMFRPWSYRHLPIRAGPGGLGSDLQNARNSLVSYWRHLLRTFRDHAARAREAMESARRNGTIISYDLNYRPSLWKSVGGKARAIEVNSELASLVDVLLGNEEDFTAALGFTIPDVDENLSQFDSANFRGMTQVCEKYTNLKVIATTLRVARTATRNDWGAICYHGGAFYSARPMPDLEIYDRVGGGDSFASGLIYGVLSGRGPQWAVDCGCAHGALAMTTPGDTTMVTLAEVERVMKGGTARVQR